MTPPLYFLLRIYMASAILIAVIAALVIMFPFVIVFFGYEQIMKGIRYVRH